jgi:glycerol-3-phosphate dehydrogenase
MTRDVQALSNKQFDLLIIGAGIYGAAAARDAALRGLSVALIDKGDFGGRTSANSLKIVHGGLRYLQTLDLARVRESILERRRMMRIAPHLLRTLPCVMPTYGLLMKSKHVMWAGLLANDVFSCDRNLHADPALRIPMGKVLSKSKTLELIPGIEPRRVTGGASWTDGQMIHSERLTLSFVLSAVSQSAVATNYVQAEKFLVRDGKVEGVRAKDVLTGTSFDIKAKTVLNTSGGWADKVNATAGSAGRIRLSTAMNLVINRPVLPKSAAGISAPFEIRRPDGSTKNGSRVLFMTPWNGVTMVGTYHLLYPGDPDDLAVRESEVQDFLAEVNRALPDNPVKREEVTFFHKGFLPANGINAKTGEVNLTPHYKLVDHKREGLDGLLSVIGVKYTTARGVAEAAVNLACRKLGKSGDGKTSRSTPVFGGGMADLASFVRSAETSAPKLKPETVRRLVSHYGTEWNKVVDPASSPKQLPGSEVFEAEILYAIQNESAVRLVDVVLRRTDLGSYGPPKAEALKACADIMAKELGWKPERVKEEIAAVEAVYKTK